MKKIALAAAAAAGMMFVSAGAMAQDGDAAAGEKAFAVCKACHTVEAGKNRVGPSLHAVVGRKAGSVESFKYSDAMKNADVVWTPENLDKYLTNPKEFVPGNKMIYAGLKDAKKRADIIAYLSQQK